MDIKFYGAAGEVTGSNILISSKGKKLLVDCGVFQGRRMVAERNYDPFPYNASEIQAVILTHAHMDHCGRLPKLYHAGFKGKIYATAPTKDLTLMALEDSAGLIAEEAEEEGIQPYFTMSDVAHIEPLFECIEYGKMFKIGEREEVRLQDAGHILGSSVVELWVDGEKAVFSGDLGNSPVPILRSPAPIESADIVVMEGTYGHQVHPHLDNRQKVLQDAIDYITKTRGTLMIPAFAIQRTQEILYELNYLAERNLIPDIPYFVDSPMAIEATGIFEKHPNYFNQEAWKTMKSGDNFFEFPGLKFTDSVEDSKSINLTGGPKVIIAGSGMLTGGRIRHHLRKYISSPKNMLLLVGYQVEGTLGRRLLDGERNIKIFDESHAVRAKVEMADVFSAHADQKQLLAWLTNIKGVKKIYLNHGEQANIEILAKRVEDQLGIKPVIATEEKIIK